MDTVKALFSEMSTNERDTVSFNMMIDGYVKSGEMGFAKKLFDVTPEKNVVSWTSMIDGYCNSGNVDEARMFFDNMPCKNLHSWNAMIGGYSRNKKLHESFVLFQELLAVKMFKSNDVTVISVLPTIVDVGSFDLENWVYEFAKGKQLDISLNVSTALVDMYAKCGEVEKTRLVFYGVIRRETCTWNALINGLALNGRPKDALEVFVEMTKEGFKPDEITMLGVLSACNHGGLVGEGKRYFKKMEELKLTPKIEHYGCLVDLLGRARCLEEAEKLIKSMPYEANGIILSSLLFACGYAKDVTPAEKVVEKAIMMEPCNDGNYIILRNLYASERRWRDGERVKRLMLTKGDKKEVECCAIEINSEFLEFIVGDNMHPCMKVTQWVLDQVRMHMKMWDLLLDVGL